MKNQKTLWIVASVVLAIVVIALLVGYVVYLNSEVKNPIVTMEVEGFGTIKLELYPDVAPNTVKHVVKLVEEGYYNGLIFHRVIPDFMIQGGDKEGTGSGSLDYALPGEFLANGFKNDLKHERGVLSMARGDYSSLGSGLTSYSYNSAGTQFFIMTKATTSLDGYYTSFGRVIEGMDVVDAISNVEVEEEDGSDRPLNPPVITSMTVDTKGVKYGEPTTVEPFDYNSWIMQMYGIDMNNMSYDGYEEELDF